MKNNKSVKHFSKKKKSKITGYYLEKKPKKQKKILQTKLEQKPNQTKKTLVLQIATPEKPCVPPLPFICKDNW